MTTAAARALPIAWISVGFAALGLTLPLAYHVPLFAPYREAVAATVGDTALATTSPTLLLCLGMTGGSIAGKWVAHLAVARTGLARGERWAVRATLAGLFAWLVLDTTVSLAQGAWANAVLINPMPALWLLPALAWYLRGVSPSDPAAPPLRPALRVALGTSVLGAASGLLIAHQGDGALFGPWRVALSAAQFAGAEVPDAARALVRFFLGPIGGSTLGHFVLVAFLVRHAPLGDERRVLLWALGSVLTWFVLDSTCSVLAGAAFNVWMVNLPALVLTAGPLGWAAATALVTPRAC